MTVHRKIKGGIRMNHELFSSMHDILDYIIAHYDSADQSEKLEFCQQIQELKAKNDYVMDHWVLFEEKLAQFFEMYIQHEPNEDMWSTMPMASSAHKQEICVDSTKHNMSIDGKINEIDEAGLITSNVSECNECDLYDIEHPQYDKAIGYYKLLMFKESADIFYQLLLDAPEWNRARLYYAMSLLHLQKWDEAKRQFQLLTVLSDFPKWLALSYNALGCLQAIQCHMGEAEKLFRRAYQIYPQFEDALKNLECCTQGDKEINLYFGSTELISM